MEVSQGMIDKYKGIDIQKDTIDPYMRSLPKYEEREDWELNLFNSDAVINYK